MSSTSPPPPYTSDDLHELLFELRETHTRIVTHAYEIERRLTVADVKAVDRVRAIMTEWRDELDEMRRLQKLYQRELSEVDDREQVEKVECDARLAAEKGKREGVERRLSVERWLWLLALVLTFSGSLTLKVYLDPLWHAVHGCVAAGKPVIDNDGQIWLHCG